MDKIAWLAQMGSQTSWLHSYLCTWNLWSTIFSPSLFFFICEAESSSSCEEHRRRRCVGRNVVEILQRKSNLAEKQRASNV